MSMHSGSCCFLRLSQTASDLSIFQSHNALSPQFRDNIELTYIDLKLLEKNRLLLGSLQWGVASCL